MWGVGPSEIVVILLVAVLLFGRNLPQVAGRVGRTLAEWKKTLHEAAEDSGLSEVQKEVQHIQRPLRIVRRRRRQVSETGKGL